MTVSRVSGSAGSVRAGPRLPGKSFSLAGRGPNESVRGTRVGTALWEQHPQCGLRVGRERALDWVQTGKPGTIPSYWAGLTNRPAFYSRDVAHQMLGAHLLGLDAEDLSMLKVSAGDVDVAGGNFRHEEHVHPFQAYDAVDVEEVARQHACGLGTQEPPPGRVGVPGRRGRCPQTLEYAADGRCGCPVAELEQLALDAAVAQAVFSRAIHIGRSEAVSRFQFCLRARLRGAAAAGVRRSSRSSIWPVMTPVRMRLATASSSATWGLVSE